MTRGRRQEDRETEAESAESETELPEAEAEEALAETSEQSAEEVEHDLEALLADVTRERDEYLELARRAKADFENYRKRAAREASEAERRGRAALAAKLVPALDNLERALAAAGVGQPVAANGEGRVEAPSEEVSAYEAFARGVGLVHAELVASLERAGVESYDPRGDAFDPALSEAISTRPAEGAKSGVVIETLERGYRIDGQVLRPARVIVSE